MIPGVLQALQAVNDPKSIVLIGAAYGIGYYIVSWLFHRHSHDSTYGGWWRKNSAADAITSFLWIVVAVVLILSLLDLLSRNELPLQYLLAYYVLWLFLFAFIYNILEWHYPGMVSGLSEGWSGELQCLVMSVSAMTAGPYTSARPAKPLAEAIAAFQSLLGLLIVVVFIAKAVALLATH